VAGRQALPKELLQQYFVLVAESALDVLAREHQELQDHFVRVRDPESDRSAIWLETVKLMSAHIAVERSFLYPVVRRRRLGGASLADLLRHDYRSMEHLVVLTERRKINSPDMPELVTKLLDVFEEHLARCDTELTPALRAALDQQELDELGTKMRAAESVIVSHPHPHLLALGPAYRLTTRFASYWDRTRDRLVRNR
jgi:Hemerythrin HHE cation binding domain